MAQATAMQRAKEGVPVKLAKKEDILDRIQGLYDAIAHRAFEIFEQSGGIFGCDLDHWFRAESELLHLVHVDLTECDTALTASAELPGFAAKELQVTLESSRLTIAGKRERKEDSDGVKSIYRERCSDQILRVIELPVEVDPDEATATLKDGVLTIEMPKAAPTRSVPIGPNAA